MSRSYKKTPICGHGGGSEKKDKRINNRMFRKQSKVSILIDDFDLMLLPINMNEVRNLWCMRKDGKSWFGYMKYEDEDISWYKKLMRK
ncbi:MAG: hypothetical protein WC979_00650 [Candidatus Pacearchaeota archaeon]|jgi:hypothetical protein|nr:hypothetical protein [Clostridia bacterium]